MKWGVTLLAFAKWQNKPFKSQDESPYTLKGRELYYKRSGKRSTISRADDLLSLHLSKIIVSGQTGKHYNFEYFLNRAYTFNRDKGKCRVCGDYVSYADLHIHHETPYLPLNQVNRVPNLVTVHEECHKKIHDGKDYTFLNKKMWNKILRFREKLKNPV
jgi:RNA-directed DNA polymerase